MQTSLRIVVLGLLFPLGFNDASALEKVLPLNTFVQDTTETVFEFQAKSAGVLTVVVRANKDVQLVVRGKDGKPVELGEIDLDYFGSGGAEQGAIVLPAAGKYQIEVRPYDLQAGLAKYRLGASWLPGEFLAPPRPHDPQTAPALVLDRWTPGQLPLGIHGNLYVYKSTAKGTLTVRSKSEIDVKLIAFQDNLRTQLAWADDEVEDQIGMDVLPLDVEPDRVYLIQVVPAEGLSEEARFELFADFKRD